MAFPGPRPQILNTFAGAFQMSTGKPSVLLHHHTIAPSPGAKSAKSANYSRFGNREDGGFIVARMNLNRMSPRCICLGVCVTGYL